ncbi:MAG: cysteine--tRNA ligase [Desulfobacteraceae bacterium]|nr:cysteine--tRNA ligase [Desulfobacteraceae bacterium]
MTIRYYDTKSGDKIPLSPLEEGHVRLYVCGITAYDFCHIGHARSALVFDMIVSYLRHRGYRVTYVRNFTDIDDKIIKRAQEQNTTPEKLAKRFIGEFYTDMELLGVAPPDIEPKATEHIPEIIALIRTLVDKGLAYAVDHDVYFRVDRFPGYGSLSGRNLEELQAGARISVDERKENPMDFALWKGSKPGEPAWDSPWGPGRPGWHIECSAMSHKYLGDTFDIHGGGKDLVFPHHENEVAQSVGATGGGFARSWIHHGFVTIRDEKMSKSLGNFLTIREALAKYHPEALRLFVYSTHYRTPLDYSEANMREATAGLDRLYDGLAEIAQLPAAGAEGGAPLAGKKDREPVEFLAARFEEAMDNDFNTAQALGHLFEAMKAMNRLRQKLPARPAAADLALLRRGADDVRRFANIMGLLREDPVTYNQEKRAKVLAEEGIGAAEIERLIGERLAARNEKNWARADEIRNELLARRIELHDTPAGTTWKVKAD